MNGYHSHRFCTVSASLLVAFFSMIQLHGDVIVTTGQDNPNGPIVGETTLRDAINDINSGSGGEIIAFAANVSTIQLLAPLPTITEQVTIDGLAMVAGTAIQPGDCALVSSPVDNPNLFEATLRIVIDGSMIPDTNTDPRIGLLFDSRATDSLVRGIRIQNFAGTSQSSFACGICATATTLNITAECCMVTTIRGRRITSNQTGAAGLENITTSSKCYIQCITTTPVNLAVTNTILQTGNAIGISMAQHVSDCRVTCVSSGSLLAPATTPLQQPALIIGIAAGIATIPDEGNIHTTKDCLFGTGSDDAQVTIKNCHVSHIVGGSIQSAIPAVVVIDIVSGIYLINTFNTLIQDCLVCDIQTGTATLTHEHANGSETTFLTTEGLYGIFMSLDEHTGCIDTNKVHHVIHGAVTMDATESVAELAPAVGIFGQAVPLVTQQNTISSIFGGCHTTQGEDSAIIPHPIGPENFPLVGPVGIFVTQEQIRSNNGAAELDPLFVVCENHVTNVAGGTRIAAGYRTFIENYGSIGIVTVATGRAVTNHNTVDTISGTNFITKVAGAESQLFFGTKGIIAEASTIELCNNAVSNVTEGKVNTAAHTFHLNDEGPSLFKKQAAIAIGNSPAQTTGITTYNVLDSITTIIRSVENNLVHTISGSSLTGSGNAIASMGAGIAMSLPLSITAPPPAENSNPLLIRCGSTLAENSIAGNTISCIASHITRPAYGILINQLPDTESIQIEQNTIGDIHGGGAAVSTTIPLAGSEQLTIIPSILPYEPTSGVYLLESNCATVHHNTIQTVGPLKNNARGITTTASSDVEISDNVVTKITGPGIFVGGAPEPIGSTFGSPLLSASVRNLIFNNHTFDNLGKGIELGVSNWSNFFAVFSFEDIPTTTIVGNHNQPAPHLTRIICNSNGTVTITACLNDAGHPHSDFIIQFFKNSTNTTPHGETPITPFDGSEFTLTTNSNGTAQKSFVFTPLVPLEPGDTITAHVTLLDDGATGSTAGTEPSEDVGDTSEFGGKTTAWTLNYLLS